MPFLYYPIGIDRQNSLMALAMFCVMCSVIADPKLGQELESELLDLKVSAMLNEEIDWRKNNTTEQDWRSSDEESSSNARWGAVSIYEDTKKLPPGFTPAEKDVEPAVDSRKAATQFRLKF